LRCTIFARSSRWREQCSILRRVPTSRSAECFARFTVQSQRPVNRLSLNRLPLSLKKWITAGSRRSAYNSMNNMEHPRFLQVVKFLVCPIILLWCSACDPDYLPKPVGYNRLELPPHEYHSLPDTLPYTFEYSKHAKLLAD